jgi:predicted DCC family thiol-disulfide oxidoreductase YuxK
MGRKACEASVAGQHLVLYDGVCGLCNAAVQFLLPRDRRQIFDYASLQSKTGQAWLARFGKNTDTLDTVVVVTDYRGSAPAMRSKADAALFVVRSLGQPWRSLALLRVLPKAVLNAGYDVVARRRYRVFGRYDACLLPRAQDKDRFIDL